MITLSRKNNEKPKVQNFLNGNTIGSLLKMQMKDSINSNGIGKSHLSNMQNDNASNSADFPEWFGANSPIDPERFSKSILLFSP